MLSATPYPVRYATLVVIDDRVSDRDRLVAAVTPGTRTIVLDPHRDGIEQIAGAVQNSEFRIQNLHIISHGSPGCIQLGSSELSLETLDRYAKQLQNWFQTTHQRTTNNEQPDFPQLLLYGCNVAAGDAGTEFVEKLHRLTGANIAASASLTGCAALGGNWDLEVRSSEFEIVPILDKKIQDSYGGILGTYSFTMGAYTLNESGSALTVPVTVQLTAGTIPMGGESLAISLGAGTATPGVDYGTNPITVSFQPGDTSKTVSIPIINDTAFEGATNETVTLTLVPLVGTAMVVGGPAVVDIVDDDPLPTISITDPAPINEPRTGTANLIFPVQLSNANNTAAVTVNYAITGGTATAGADYGTPTPLSGTLTFSPGNTTPDAPLTIPINSDLDGDEANETIVVTLSMPSATANGIATNMASATGRILDSDADAVPDTFPITLPVVAPFSPPYPRTIVLPNTATTLDLTSNDDPGVDGVSVVIVDLANTSEPFFTGTLEATTDRGGTVSFSGRGGVQYQPPSNFLGTDRFRYRITNEPGDRDAAIVTVVVSTPPIANDDSVTTTLNTPVQIQVLNNDIEPDANLGDTISIFNGSVTQPANGVISLSGGTLITYTPNPGFTGTDVFQYQAIDAQGLVSEPATVTINGANPNAVDDFARTPEGENIIIDVLENDTDPNGATLSILSFDTTGANGGRIERTLEGKLSFTPRPGFEGFDRFSYTVTDPEGDTDTAIVEVLVASINQPPMAVDDTASTIEGTPITIDVLANDFDPEDQPISIIDANPTSFNGGTVTITGNAIAYEPPPNFVGIDTFDYVIGDERNRTSLATVTITVGETGVEDCAIFVASPPIVAATPTTNIVPGSDGDDTLVADDNVNTILSGLGNDIAIALGGNDNLNGQDGNDTLFGNQGNDFIDGDLGDDLIFAGRDDDFVMGNDGEDGVMADIGNDGVLGGNGNDMLFGNQGNDRIDGEEGDDSIFGGRDADALRGSNGNDFLSGDMGDDTVQGGNDDDTLLGGDGRDILDGCQGNDELHGGSGTDTAFGGSGDDTLYGNGGNDVLEAGIGNDILFGGAGEDTLRGGAGDDRLSGDAGSDVLVGGAGIDEFIIAPGQGIDAINDFTTGEDLLVLTGGLTVDRINLRVEPQAIFVTDVATGEVLAALVGISESQVVPEDFVVG